MEIQMFCKAWIEEHEKFSVISNSDYIEARNAADRLMADETISELISGSDKQVHVSGLYKDEATKMVIPVQCLIDLAPKKDSPFQKSLCDLKTTRNASQRPFARQVFTFGWHIQAAMDLALYAAATGEDRCDWLFVAQENYAPFQTGRRLLSQDFIDIGRHAFQSALKRYARCLKTGVWDGYDPAEQFSLVAPEPYMSYESLSETLENDQIEAIQESDDIIP